MENADQHFRYRESTLEKYLAEGRRKFIILVGDSKNQEALAEHYVQVHVKRHAGVQYKIRKESREIPNGTNENGWTYIRYAYGMGDRA